MRLQGMDDERYNSVFAEKIAFIHKLIEDKVISGISINNVGVSDDGFMFDWSFGPYYLELEYIYSSDRFEIFLFNDATDEEHQQNNIDNLNVAVGIVVGILNNLRP
jgi:hypothetical protein